VSFQIIFLQPSYAILVSGLILWTLGFLMVSYGYVHIAPQSPSQHYQIISSPNHLPQNQLHNLHDLAIIHIQILDPPYPNIPVHNIAQSYLHHDTSITNAPNNHQIIPDQLSAP
jgi:hypothetical protein